MIDIYVYIWYVLMRGLGDKGVHQRTNESNESMATNSSVKLALASSTILPWIVAASCPIKFWTSKLALAAWAAQSAVTIFMS